jgi:hypothetical protein
VIAMVSSESLLMSYSLFCHQGGKWTSRTLLRRKHNIHRLRNSKCIIMAVTFLLLMQQMMTIDAQDDVDWDLNAQNNPDNKYCGLSYEEAHGFCHLPPKQSLPCPNGESECPYGMPCWEITEECTQPPTLAPTDRPTRSPITAKSDDPTDHYFCGLGFDQLYDW